MKTKNNIEAPPPRSRLGLVLALESCGNEVRVLAATRRSRALAVKLPPFDTAVDNLETANSVCSATAQLCSQQLTEERPPPALVQILKDHKHENK